MISGFFKFYSTTLILLIPPVIVLSGIYGYYVGHAIHYDAKIGYERFARFQEQIDGMEQRLIQRFAPLEVDFERLERQLQVNLESCDKRFKCYYEELKEVNEKIRIIDQKLNETKKEAKELQKLTNAHVRKTQLEHQTVYRKIEGITFSVGFDIRRELHTLRTEIQGIRNIRQELQTLRTEIHSR